MLKHGGWAFQTSKLLPHHSQLILFLLTWHFSIGSPFQLHQRSLYIEGTGKKSTRSHYRTRRMQDFKFDTMPSNTADQSPDSGTTGMSLKDTELTLGLPGEAQGVIVGGKSCSKRGYSHTVDFRFRCCSGESSAKAEQVDWPGNEISGPGKAPDSKAQVVGWPPVRSVRKKALKSCKYVKVAVDGAPYLRKVDLEVHRSYQQLLMALETMFDCFTISSNDLEESKIMNPINGAEYVPTYEDKDGDWMLVGDVPWNMFVESCKRVRLMKSSEAIGLAPRTPSCTSTT